MITRCSAQKNNVFFFKVSQISVDMNEPNKAISYVPRDSPKGAWGKTYQTIWSLHLDDFKQIPNWSEVIKLMVYDTGILPEIGQWFNHGLSLQSF